jgi:hypothetical protein
MNDSSTLSPPTKPIWPLKRNPLRPHSLDALFRCDWFLSEPGQKPAAARGSSLDQLLRDLFAGRPAPVAPEDKRGFDWAAAQTLELAKGFPVLTDRTACKVPIPGFERPGECDAVIPGALTSLDWKSGQIRSYKRQMAAYALGRMLLHFCREWTAAVLFYDQEETEFFRFEYEEALELLTESQAKYWNPGPPVINESCSWCANFYGCPTQLELAGRALTIPTEALAWDQIKESPELLSKFLLGVKALERFGKEGREIGRQFFFQKIAIPGFRLANGKRSWSMLPETLLQELRNQDQGWDWAKTLEQTLLTFPDISKEQYLQICQKFEIEPDETKLREHRGEPYITANRR